MTKYFVALFLTFCCGLANAQYVTAGFSGSTPLGSCRAYGASGNPWTNMYINPAEPGRWYCYGTRSDGALGGPIITEGPAIAQCPAGQVSVNGQCVQNCPDSEHQMMSATGSCYTPNCQQMGSPATWIWNRTANACEAPPPPAACPAGQTDLGISLAGTRICKPRVCPFPSVLKADGTCGADDNVQPELRCPDGSHPNMAKTRCEPNPKDEPDPCPPGTHNISANAALPNCTANTRPPDSPPEVTKSDTKVQPDGTTTKTETTQASASNNDGTATITTTTTTTTVNSANQPVGSPIVVVRKTTVLDGSGTPGSPPGRPTGTVTTATAGDGTQTTSSTKGTAPGDNPDAKETDLCKLHPTLNICKNSAVSGDCENLVCEGDAIQCAILRQQKKEYCDNTKDNALKTFGDQMLTGSDPRAGEMQTRMDGTTVDLSQQSFDQSGFLGGGACFSNRSITFRGAAVPVDFTALCSNISALRFVILAVALFAGYMLVSKSVLHGA